VQRNRRDVSVKTLPHGTQITIQEVSGQARHSAFSVEPEVLLPYPLWNPEFSYHALCVTQSSLTLPSVKPRVLLPCPLWNPKLLPCPKYPTRHYFPYYFLIPERRLRRGRPVTKYMQRSRVETTRSSSSSKVEVGSEHGPCRTASHLWARECHIGREGLLLGQSSCHLLCGLQWRLVSASQDQQTSQSHVGELSMCELGQFGNGILSAGI
jgi:hypothetical protein